MVSKTDSIKAAVLCLILLIAAAGPISAQIPQTINYQGILTDAGGTAVADGAYSIAFKLYDVSSGGSELWTETQTVTVLKGVFSTVLGGVTPVNLAFDKPYWLGVAVGGGSELTPRIALTTSPYSFNAQKVAGIDASTTPTANMLVPLDGTGKFPASVIPSAPASGLTLPYSGSASSADPAFAAANTGTGAAIQATSGSSGDILSGKSGATTVLTVDRYGSTGIKPVVGANHPALSIENAAAQYSLRIENTGVAQAVYIEQKSGNSDAVYVSAAAGNGEGFQVLKDGGIGNCFEAQTKGTGHAGYLIINNAASSSDAIFGSTNGTGSVLKVNHLGASGNIALFQSASSTKVSIDKSGNVVAAGYVQTNSILGNTATPVNNAVYSDNVLQVWADVLTNGTLYDGFGCTTSRTGVGTYKITYKSPLTTAYAPVVTAYESSKPQFAVISGVTINDCTVKIWQFDTTTKTFLLVDSRFFVHVAGRH